MIISGALISRLGPAMSIAEDIRHLNACAAARPCQAIIARRALCIIDPWRRRHDDTRRSHYFLAAARGIFDIFIVRGQDFQIMPISL